MSQRRVRLERTVRLADSQSHPSRVQWPPGREGDVVEYVISTELPPAADRWDVALAAIELGRIAPLFGELSACCGVPRGAVHHPACPSAPDDLIEQCYAAMEAERA